MNKLVNTEEASRATGLSPLVLRNGWRTGLYPAIELGGGGRGVRLRWDIDLLEKAIFNQMENDRIERSRSNDTLEKPVRE